MSLNIGNALRDGADRTLERTGVVLMAGFAVLGLATALLQQTYLEWYFEWIREVGMAPPGFEQPTLPLSLGLSPGVAVGGILVLALVAEAFRIVAVRTLVGDHTDRIPAELVTHNIAVATVNGFVGGVVVLLLVGFGSLLVLPGIFLAVAFVFVRQEIAVEDETFVDAMVNSWRLTAGNRVELAVLGIVWITVLVLTAVLGAAAGIVLPEGSPAGPVVSVGIRAPATVFVVASAARAYVQLTGEDAGATTPDEDDGEEWPDPPGVDV
jgi:hypothetical protein